MREESKRSAGPDSNSRGLGCRLLMTIYRPVFGVTMVVVEMNV